MRRGTSTALLGATIALLLTAGVLAAGAQEDLHLRLLDQLGIVDSGDTFSEAATNRDCPAPRLEDGHPPKEQGTLQLVSVGTAEAPTSAAFLPGESGDGFLAERAGTVRRVDAGKITDDVVLDVSEDTYAEGDGGLVAIAVDPEGAFLYVERTQLDRDDVITAYPIGDDGRLAVDEARVIIRSGHPPSMQHHGGSLAFDKAGLLYFGFGDGGGLGDPRENAQNLDTLLGKVVRIRPTPEGPDPYEIPDDNPFVGQADRAPEIFAYGVRNPFRLTYDATTDSVWLGDVGQSCWEEVDHLTKADAGSNLGWDVLEGTHDFEGGTVNPPVLSPYFEINHVHGWCAIVVGPVQRGGALPSLEGRLLVSDYCRGAVWSLDPDDPTDIIDTDLQAKTTTGLVQGPFGRPWVFTLDGQVLEIRDH